MSRSPQILATVALAMSAFVAADALAASVRVTCEVRPNRSKVSIDGRNLVPGDYTTVAESGANRASTGPVASVGDEVETDYDSNPADIADGATPIAANFIQGGVVTGKVLDSGGAVVAMRTVPCRIRR
jgi:hypothetical protein